MSARTRKRVHMSPKAREHIRILEEGTEYPGLHITHLTNARQLCWKPLADAARALPVEQLPACRAFVAYKGQKHFPGFYWSATTRDLLGYDSLTERLWIMLKDFDLAVTGIATQPFWIHGNDNGRRWSHCPDIATRTAAGVTITDVRPKDHQDEQFAATAALTRDACEQVGWRYEILDAPDSADIVANVRWLAGYRRPIADLADCTDALLAACTQPMRLDDLVSSVGDPLIVKPVAFQLLWQQRLQMDLRAPLRGWHLIGPRGWLS